MKYNTETFIEKGNKIHYNKYDYSLVNYKKSSIKVKIICPTHGVFEQTPNNHIRNNNPRGCPKCVGKNKTNNEFIIEANKIHNSKYDYNKINYINAKTPIIIKCPIHGEFKQKPNNHLNGWGCKKCGGNDKLTTEEFIKKANKVHRNRYDYSLVDYVDSHTKVKIICKEHGKFTQKPNNHLMGNNCPKCIKILHAENRTLSTTEFIIKANEIHNNKYDYSKTTYTKSKNRVKIICPTHGIFTQIAGSHLSGSGCPNCNESKGELKIKKAFKKYNIEYIFQKSFDDCRNKNNRKLKFDFYLPKQNILIEYDGRQHYEPIEYFGGRNSFKTLNEHDNIKNTYAKINNIILIRISYQQYNEIETIVKNIQ